MEVAAEALQQAELMRCMAGVQRGKIALSAPAACGASVCTARIALCEHQHSHNKLARGFAAVASQLVQVESCDLDSRLKLAACTLNVSAGEQALRVF
jgi:hypothetical protein